MKQEQINGREASMTWTLRDELKCILPALLILLGASYIVGMPYLIIYLLGGK